MGCWCLGVRKRVDAGVWDWDAASGQVVFVGCGGVRRVETVGVKVWCPDKNGVAGLCSGFW